MTFDVIDSMTGEAMWSLRRIKLLEGSFRGGLFGLFGHGYFGGVSWITAEHAVR